MAGKFANMQLSCMFWQLCNLSSASVHILAIASASNMEREAVAFAYGSMQTLKKHGSFAALASALLATLMLAACIAAPNAFATETAIPSVGKSQWTRIWGSDRYGTMLAIGTHGFSKCDTVVIATGANFPDALAASSLAGSCSSPLVLVDGGTISQDTLSYISSLKASKAIIIGGINAVPASVENALENLGLKVERLGGKTRIHTALLVDGKLPGTSKTAFVCSGANFPDALSISPYAYATCSPIYLAQDDGTLDANTVAAIKAGGYTSIVIVGGTSAVAASVASTQLAGLSCTRLGGADRYETSCIVAKWAVDAGVLSYEDMAVATGQTYPDALSGGALCGSKKSVLLLVDNADPARAEEFVNQKGAQIKQGWVLGGTSALGDDAAHDVEESANFARYSGILTTSYVCNGCGYRCKDWDTFSRHLALEKSRTASFSYETRDLYFYVPDEQVTSTDLTVLKTHVLSKLASNSYTLIAIWKCNSCGYTGYLYEGWGVALPDSVYAAGDAAINAWVEQNLLTSHDCTAYWKLGNGDISSSPRCNGCKHVSYELDEHGAYEHFIMSAYTHGSWGAYGDVTAKQFLECTQGRCEHFKEELAK